MNILFNVIIPLVSALIGGFISLFIYKEGEKKKEQVERKRKLESHYQTEQYFFHNIESILFFIDCQVDEISITSQNCKNWNINKLGLAIRSELKLNELRELDFKTLYQIFVIDKKGNLDDKASTFIDIKNCLHNLEDFIVDQKDQNSRPFEEIINNIELWNLSLQRLMELFNSFVLRKPSNDDKLMPVLHTYLVRKQREMMENKTDQNIKNFFENLILPMQNDIIALKGDIDSRAELIIKEVLNLKKAYIQIHTIRYHRRKDILITGRRLLEIKRLLRKSSDKIKNSKPRVS